MRAKFEFSYQGLGSVEVEVDVESHIETDKDKKDFITSVADILGIKVGIPKTDAELLWEQDNED